jgi:hypothetical protein
MDKFHVFYQNKKAPPDHFAAKSPLPVKRLSAAIRGVAVCSIVALRQKPQTAAQSVFKILS